MRRVSQHPRTERELRAIQSNIGRKARQAGMELQILTSSGDVVTNAVEIHVVLLTEEARAWLDERYGPGTVRATAALQPVD